jgi:uncharacterized delta-60 repeat protein
MLVDMQTLLSGQSIQLKNRRRRVMRPAIIARISPVALVLFLSQARAMDPPEPRLFSPHPGVLRIDVGPLPNAAGIAIQQDGTIALAATPIVGGHAQGVLLRVTRDGRLADRGITPIAAVARNARDLAITPDDKLVVVGDGYAPEKTASQQNHADFLVARFLSDGTPDQSFGQQGWVMTDVGEREDHDYPRSVAVQPDGKIVAAGDSNVKYWLILRAYSFATVRYDRDGSLDKGFGDRGRVITRMGVSREDSGNAVLIQPDGKIVVAGTADSWREDRSERADFALARYLPDGRLDNSFGEKGKGGPIGPLGLGPLENGIGRAALDQSGRIVVGGYMTVSDDRPHSMNRATAPVLARYNSDGSLDRSFGTNGLVGLAPKGEVGQGGPIAIDSSGKIVTACRIPRDTGGPSWVVVRRNEDGSIDRSFADSGFSSIPFIAGASRMAFQQDGKLLVLGSDNNAILLLRLNPDGTPDPEFGAAAGQLR